MSLLTDSNLLPFRQFAEAEVINIFKLDGTGLAGQLVSIQAGNQDPSTSAGAYQNRAPNGVAFTNVGNYTYGTLRAVRPSATTDNKGKLMGVTLYTTATHDENGNVLVNMPYDQTLERGFVNTGFAVPILSRGIITIKKTQVNGDALPGYIGIPGANGTITALDSTAANLALIGASGNAVGKFISASGSAFGGYYQFKLEL